MKALLHMAVHMAKEGGGSDYATWVRDYDGWPLHTNDVVKVVYEDDEEETSYAFPVRVSHVYHNIDGLPDVHLNYIAVDGVSVLPSATSWLTEEHGDIVEALTDAGWVRT